jgi:HNH endonuclease
MPHQIKSSYINQTCFYFRNCNGVSVLSAPIPGKQGYWVGVDGTVFSFKRTKLKILKPANNGNSYLFVILSVNGKSEKNYVSRLVAATFLAKPIEADSSSNQKNEVNHCDGNRTNNKLPNLEWCSSAENHDHAKRVLRSKDFLASKYAEAYIASKAA